MKKVILFSLVVFFASQNGFSQELKQSVIASAGGIANSDKISLEWTLGEFAVETITSSKNLYTQGFHQPLLMVKSFHSPPPVSISSDYKVLLYPNPAQSFVNVFINAKGTEKFSLVMYDMWGKRIQSKQINGMEISVRFEMERLTSGVYLMEVRNDAGTIIKAFKIVKAE